MCILVANKCFIILCKLFKGYLKDFKPIFDETLGDNLIIKLWNVSLSSRGKFQNGILLHVNKI